MNSSVDSAEVTPHATTSPYGVRAGKHRQSAPGDPRSATGGRHWLRAAPVVGEDVVELTMRARRPGKSAPRRAAAGPTNGVGAAGVMLRSPISTRGPGKPRRSRTRWRSCTRFQPGYERQVRVGDRHRPQRGLQPRDHRRARFLVDHHHPIGSAQVHRKLRIGIRGRRTTCQLSPGNRDSSAMPYAAVPGCSRRSRPSTSLPACRRSPRRTGGSPRPSPRRPRAVRSAFAERGWSRSTSCSASTSASSSRTDATSRSSSTRRRGRCVRAGC